jgi:hypothetical protein
MEALTGVDELKDKMQEIEVNIEREKAKQSLDQYKL